MEEKNEKEKDKTKKKTLCGLLILNKYIFKLFIIFSLEFTYEG